MRQINNDNTLQLFKSYKKIILFIVDGNHDETEMNAMLRVYCPKLLETHSFMFLALDENDITSDEKTDAKKIVGKINDQLVNWRLRGGHQYIIYPHDIERVVHIIDTDGAFIPDEAVIEDKNIPRIQYNDSDIHTRELARTLKRNKRKTEIVKRLINIKTIDNLPYSIWFVSCNMDHLLFNKRNPKKIDKRMHAESFSDNCKSPDYLSRTVFADGIRADGTYEESWDFIMSEYNSLNRHCNINLLLDELKNAEE